MVDENNNSGANQLASKRFLTSAEFAAEAGIKEQTVNAWRCRGIGPKFVKIGNAVRYERTEIEKYFASRTAGSTTQAEMACA